METFLPDKVTPYKPAPRTPEERAQIAQFAALRKQVAAQWCGVGAVPGGRTADTNVCSRPACTRDSMGPAPVPMVMPGVSAGPHAFDADEGRGVPVNCAPFAMPYMLPDREVYTDPMDPRMWTPATSGTEDATDPALVWGRPAGLW